MVNSKTVKCVYAKNLKTNKIIHVSELDEELRGRDCNCVCYKCNQPMWAKLGKERAWHFSHEPGVPECAAPEEINETALHRLAKELFLEKQPVFLPAYTLSGDTDPNCNENDPEQLKDYEGQCSQYFKYEIVQIEKSVEGIFKPDVILKNGEEILYIEIAVRHPIDPKKRNHIEEYGESCIEINLFSFLGENLDRKRLKKILFEEIGQKKWIHHKNKESFLKELQNRNRKCEEEFQKKKSSFLQDKLYEPSWRNNWKKEPQKDSYYTSNVHIDELLEQLNEEQRGPVLQTEGAVLVLAGAGSGKTRVLTTRIAYLVEEKQVPPEAILAITFTNKAANEMKERLSRYIDTERMWVSTIHSMCVRIIRMYADEVGVKSNFSIYSETERNNIIKKSFQECDFEGDQLLKTVKYHIGNAKMLGLEPDEYAEEYSYEREIDEIVKVYKRYQKHLKENNSLDFDDLLSETRKLLQTNEEARNYLGSRFRYILVDEFQDTNSVQFEIINYLASIHGNLFVVGDDDQSIYGWRGAEIKNILGFEKAFKDAKVFKLERNYRSTKHILKLANAVISNNANRKKKTLWTENEEGAHAKVYEAEEESGEARYIAQTIAGLIRQGYSYSDFAILMRINALTRSFEQEFTGDGIPYKVFGGFKFFERKEIKDLLAYLRLINNPFDSEAALRIINFPKRGIGAKTVESLQQYAYGTELSIYDALLDIDEIGFSSATREKLVGFRDLITKWIKDSLDMPVNELVKTIIEDSKMREAYADDSDESINKRANIEEFINSVDEYCKLNVGATLTDYLNQVTLSSDTDEMDDGNYVTLATIHAVKGLEFGFVFLCGMEENTMPISRAVDSEDDMEEERRLMYVAITRAKERIYFTRSKSRYLYGKREPTMRSRFLKELSSEIELPQERRPMARGYSDWDDPESYGNSAYGGGRYASNDDYGGRRTSFGGGYGSYGGNYGGYDSSRSNSSITRTSWNGPTYGSGAKPTPTKQTAARVFGGAGKPLNPTPTKDLSVFTLGKKVRHPKFGEGTIVGARGTGANMIIDVAFDGLGIKQLSASLAPLTVL